MVQAQMRESVKVILVIIIVMILPTITTSAQSKPVVRIGIYDNHPLVSLDAAGAPRGLFIDLIDELASQENWDVRFVYGVFSDNLQLLSDGKLDLIAAIAASEGREALYDFSAESGCILWGTVYVQPKSSIQSVLDLEGKSIAIVENGIYGVELRKLLSNFNITSSITETSSQVDSLRLLMERKVDAAVFNNAFKEPYGETETRRTSIIFSPLKIGFAASEGQNTYLLRAIDRAIGDWKEDRDSFYYRSLNRWLGAIEVRSSFVPPWLTYVLLSTMAAIVVFVLWVVALRRQIALRKTAEEEIRALHDILPICSICKNIRNDDGYYEKIEAYMHKHSGVDFTHTICPSCLETHYPAQYERIMGKTRDPQ
jgi:ABC-type amino acid transport substrate-binding protein